MTDGILRDKLLHLIGSVRGLRGVKACLIDGYHKGGGSVTAELSVITEEQANIPKLLDEIKTLVAESPCVDIFGSPRATTKDIEFSVLVSSHKKLTGGKWEEHTEL